MSGDERRFFRWDEAFDYVRERNRPEVVLIDDQHYKVYPSGHALCAASRPFHAFEGSACDCQARESGGTIRREVLSAPYSVTVHYSSGHSHSTPCESLDEAIEVCRAKRATAPSRHSFVRIYGDGAEGGYGEDGMGTWDGLEDDERERIEAEGLL